MRLWTLHPCYLDSKGLVAAWREALLAKKVLEGGTRGYKNHPQLSRFRSHERPLPAMAAFLSGLTAEAERRGYHFDTSKVPRRKFRGRMDATRGQLLYEWKHLRAKLRKRAPALHRKLRLISVPKAHPLFRVIPGPIEPWEKPANPQSDPKLAAQAGQRPENESKSGLAKQPGGGYSHPLFRRRVNGGR
jgi:hypothetical protein